MKKIKMKNSLRLNGKQTDQKLLTESKGSKK